MARCSVLLLCFLLFDNAWLGLTRNHAMFVWRVIGVFCVWLIVACQSRSVAGCGCECLA